MDVFALSLQFILVGIPAVVYAWFGISCFRIAAHQSNFQLGIMRWVTYVFLGLLGFWCFINVIFIFAKYRGWF